MEPWSRRDRTRIAVGANPRNPGKTHSTPMGSHRFYPHPRGFHPRLFMFSHFAAREGWCEWRMFRFQVVVIKDLARLDLLFALFAETLDELCRMGSACGNNPRVKL